MVVDLISKEKQRLIQGKEALAEALVPRVDRRAVEKNELILANRNKAHPGKRKRLDLDSRVAAIVLSTPAGRYFL
jgi:hypothetical protein